MIADRRWYVMYFPKLQDGAFLSDNNELDTLLASSKEMEHLVHDSVFKWTWPTFASIVTAQNET